MNELLSRLWRLGRPLQWRFLWFMHANANKGERHEDTIAREVREETGLTVEVGRLVKVRSGYKYRIEVYYEATLTGDLSGLSLDPREILEARLFRPDDLPVAMPDLHRELAVLGPAQAGAMPG
jgi:8-oxo-dGTP diphosphatase